MSLDLENTSTHYDLENRVRESDTLRNRLINVRERIGKMCKELRPPKMTIPVQWNDDDFFISTTADDAIHELHDLRNIMSRMLSEPWGCSLCDSGVPRNPEKGHQPTCPYELARIALERNIE